MFGLFVLIVVSYLFVGYSLMVCFIFHFAGFMFVVGLLCGFAVLGFWLLFLWVALFWFGFALY